MSLTLTIVVLQLIVIAGSLIVGRGRSSSGQPASTDARQLSVATRVMRVIDVSVIDSAMNGVGLVIRGWSVMLRRLPVGARWQLVAAVSAVVAALGYFLWR